MSYDFNQDDFDTIAALLKDENFMNMVEDDIGKLICPVKVDWIKNEIRFYGEKIYKKMFIDETLAILRGRVQ